MCEENKTKKRYDRIAAIYDKVELILEKAKIGVWRENLWQRVAENVPPNDGKLLEAGVGTGKNIEYYPENIEIYAIDFSEKMLDRARLKAKKYNKNINLINMDIQNLEFADNYF